MYRHKCKRPGCDVTLLGEPQKQYCSPACRQRAYRQRQKNQRKAVTLVRFVRCRNCGLLFETRQPRAEFHSTSCRVSFWQQQKRLEQLEWKNDK